MHRTQVLLKPHQYEALMVRARQSGAGLSELIRKAVDQMLELKPRPTVRLMDICGIGRSKGRFDARDHDRFLYGT